MRKKLIRDLNKTIDHWINELDHYTLVALRAKPSPLVWSLGQVYTHLVKNTRHYIEQVKICLSVADNGNEAPFDEAIKMFAKNELPDAIIDGPDTNVFIRQPQSKQELKNALLSLKHE